MIADDDDGAFAGVLYRLGDGRLGADAVTFDYVVSIRPPVSR